MNQTGTQYTETEHEMEHVFTGVPGRELARLVRDNGGRGPDAWLACQLERAATGRATTWAVVPLRRLPAQGLGEPARALAAALEAFGLWSDLGRWSANDADGKAGALRPSAGARAD